MDETNRTKNTSRILIAGIICIGLCLSCLIAAIVYNRPIQVPLKNGGLPITVCAGAAIQPHFQLGVAWVSIISSYLPPLTTSPFSICVSIPLNLQPPRVSGEWVFPP